MLDLSAITFLGSKPTSYSPSDGSNTFVTSLSIPLNTASLMAASPSITLMQTSEINITMDRMVVEITISLVFHSNVILDYFYDAYVLRNSIVVLPIRPTTFIKGIPY